MCEYYREWLERIVPITCFLNVITLGGFVASRGLYFPVKLYPISKIFGRHAKVYNESILGFTNDK